MDVQSLLDGLISVLLMPLTWMLDGCILVIGYTLVTFMDGWFQALLVIVGLIDVTSIVQNFVLQLTGLPPQLLFLLNAIHFPQAVSVITAAYGIRFALNLIPAAFTRI